MTADKIFLRPLTGKDIDTIYSLTSDPEVAKYMRFSTHTCRKEAEELFHEYTKTGNLGWLICLTEDESPVGIAALKQEENVPDTCSMSVFFYPDCWNKGYSTEVVGHMINAAAAEKIRCLKAYVVQDNAGSCRVLEKSGFALQEILHFPDMPSGLCIYSFQL